MWDNVVTCCGNHWNECHSTKLTIYDIKAFCWRYYSNNWPAKTSKFKCTVWSIWPSYFHYLPFKDYISANSWNSLQGKGAALQWLTQSFCVLHDLGANSTIHYCIIYIYVPTCEFTTHSKQSEVSNLGNWAAWEHVISLSSWPAECRFWTLELSLASAQQQEPMRKKVKHASDLETLRKTLV